MLKLTHPVIFDNNQLLTIRQIISEHNSGKKRWSSGKAKSIKNHISVHCLSEQRCYCAFCEGLVNEGDAPIEHISPKGLTPEFVFEPNNLVVSCTRCNSTTIKGERPTIIGDVVPIYQDNDFCIVHPRLDNSDEHIIFQDEQRTIFELPRCSEKGLATIKFFRWDNINAFRARVAAASTRGLDLDQLKLIYEISTYK